MFFTCLTNRKRRDDTCSTDKLTKETEEIIEIDEVDSQSAQCMVSKEKKAPTTALKKNPRNSETAKVETGCSNGPLNYKVL